MFFEMLTLLQLRTYDSRGSKNLHPRIPGIFVIQAYPGAQVICYASLGRPASTKTAGTTLRYIP